MAGQPLLTTQSSDPKIEHEGSFPCVFCIQVSEASAGGLWGGGAFLSSPVIGRKNHGLAGRHSLVLAKGLSEQLLEKKKVVFDFTSVSLASHGDGTKTRNGASLPPNLWPFSDFMGLKKKDSILFCWNADFL